MVTNKEQNSANFSEFAELQVLGSVLNDSESLSIAREIIKPIDFYNALNQAIYIAMCDLEDSNQTINLATLQSKLAGNQLFNEKGGISYLIKCQDDLPSASLISTYANLVRNDSIRRRISQFSSKLNQITSKPIEDIDSTVSKLGDELLSITSYSKSAPWQDFKTSLQITCDEIFQSDDFPKVKSGFIDLDAKLNCFRPGTLTIVAARPAMGKTAFGLNILGNVAFRQGMSVAFFSLEMTITELVSRIMSSETSINGNAIRQKKMTDDEWASLLDFTKKHFSDKIFIDETPGIDISVLRDRAKRLHRIYGIELIIVDYLQLMHSDNKRVLNREQEVSTISRGLKEIAKDLKIPVIALAQLNRGVEGRADKHPILSDLRESGSIEQDADNIIFIHREDYYRQDDQKDNTAEIIISKQRNGPTGIVKLHWDGELTRFSNLEYSNM